MAFLSLGVVALFAVVTTTLAIKVFQKAAVQ
jgi:hypothetical protein